MAKAKSQLRLVFRDDDFEDIEQQENEDDLSIQSKDFDEIVVVPADWTIGSLVGQIGKQMKLDPDFQRRGVWTDKSKIKFIESLFLNIPVPQILLAPRKEDKNAYIVLDGKQRLLAIKEFHDGKFDSGKPFVLKGLKLLKELEGKDWPMISSNTVWENRFLNQTLRAAVLKAWKKEDVLYEVFHRLNSGSVGLSPMELRTSLHSGGFLKEIIKWTEDPKKLHELLRLRKPDKRMADAELALRFIAFSEQDEPYDGNLKGFLDRATQKLNSDYLKSETAPKRIASRLKEMEAAITAAIEIFGISNVCRKWKDGDYESRFNRAVFDVVIGSLAQSSLRTWALKHKTQFENKFIACCKTDREFVASFETSTKNIAEVRKRFKTWYDAVEEISGIALKTPRITNSK